MPTGADRRTVQTRYRTHRWRSLITSRKRTEKEKKHRCMKSVRRDIIEKMLPVVDNFERGLVILFRRIKKDRLLSPKVWIRYISSLPTGA